MTNRRSVWKLATVGLGLGLSAALAWAAAANFLLISKQAKHFASTADFPAVSPKPAVDRAANRLRYTTVSDIHLTALAGPEQKMMSFEIDGLSNPEIQIPRGSRLTLNVVNVDDDMDHNLYLTAQAPPYGREVTATLGTPTLKPHTTGPYAGAVLILQASHSGTSYYVCTVRGHARAGMYGKITVLP